MSEARRNGGVTESDGAIGRGRQDVEFGGRGVDARIRERRAYPRPSLRPGMTSPSIGQRGASTLKRAEGDARGRRAEDLRAE